MYTGECTQKAISQSIFSRHLVDNSGCVVVSLGKQFRNYIRRLCIAKAHETSSYSMPDNWSIL